MCKNKGKTYCNDYYWFNLKKELIINNINFSLTISKNHNIIWDSFQKTMQSYKLKSLNTWMYTTISFE